MCVVLAGMATRAPAPHRVLFVGNSLTAANDLPHLVEALAAAGGVQVTTHAIALPDFSLEDHWDRGDAQKAIAGASWEFVVLQQGPSALPESQVALRRDTKRFDPLIRRAGARTALYMVWPFDSRRFDFDRVSESYANAAKDVDGVLLPVGDAWQAAWRRDASIALYGPDGFHPTPAASYLAGLVMVHRLFRVSPIGLPASVPLPSGAPIRVDVRIATLMQKVVAQERAEDLPPDRGRAPQLRADR